MYAIERSGLIDSTHSSLATPTTAARLYVLSLSDLDRGLAVDGSVAHTLLDLACHCQEGLLDVARVLCRCLEERDTQAVRELLQHGGSATWRLMQDKIIDTYLCNSIFNHLLICHIALIAYEQLVHALRSIAINLLQPLLDIVEAIHIRDIVDDTDAVCASIVRGSDRPEPLLARGIPLRPC